MVWMFPEIGYPKKNKKWMVYEGLSEKHLDDLGAPDFRKPRHLVIQS